MILAQLRGMTDQELFINCVVAVICAGVALAAACEVVSLIRRLMGRHTSMDLRVPRLPEPEGASARRLETDEQWDVGAGRVRTP